jgi:hypothetical protein
MAEDHRDDVYRYCNCCHTKRFQCPDPFGSPHFSIFRARSILLTHLACCTALSRSTRTAERYGTRAKGSDGPTKTRGTTNRQGASKTTVCAKVEQFGGVPYPPEVTNFTPSLPLDRRGQGSQSTEFENRWVTSMWYSVEIVTALRSHYDTRTGFWLGHQDARRYHRRSAASNEQSSRNQPLTLLWSLQPLNPRAILTLFLVSLLIV